MKPLVWDTPNDIKPNDYVLFDWENRKTDSYIFMGGKTLPCADVGQLNYSQDPKNYDLVYTYKCSEEHLKCFDNLPNTGQAPLVNKRVLDILNRFCPDDIQAFPATIIPEKGSKHTFENHDYWVINITKLMEAIDEEKSELKYFSKNLGGQPFGAKKLVFRDEQNNDFCLARDNILSLKLVSSSLATAFKDANITGVQFIEDKDYGRI